MMQDSNKEGHSEGKSSSSGTDGHSDTSSTKQTTGEYSTYISQNASESTEGIWVNVA